MHTKNALSSIEGVTIDDLIVRYQAIQNQQHRLARKRSISETQRDIAKSMESDVVGFLHLVEHPETCGGCTGTIKFLQGVAQDYRICRECEPLLMPQERIDIYEQFIADLRQAWNLTGTEYDYVPNLEQEARFRANIMKSLEVLA